MKWSDIPMAYKIASGAVGTVLTVIGAATGWMFATFETADAAEQKWAQHNQAIACSRVYEWQAEIRRYLEQLRRDVTLTAADREWISQEIEELRENVRRLDPDGRC